VAEIAVGVARQFGCAPELERDVRRAALLHDIGKLGVSNMVLDKPGKLTDEEFDQIRLHPDYSLQILEQVDAFKQLADVASAHHERLDGQGYHRRLSDTQVPWVGRVLAVADICEAMSAKRPYRDAMPWEKIQQILSKDAGSGVDPECLHALERWQDRNQMESRVEAQLREVDRLLADL
jgi:putative nucleotidyltransferase with HDIG domain